MQSGLYLTVMRGLGAPEARICYECAEPLCHSLNRPRLLFIVLAGRFRYTIMRDKLSAAIWIAERLYALAQEQNDAALISVAYSTSRSRFTFWASSKLRDNTRGVVFSSGVREVFSLLRKCTFRQSSTV
jgi:hypothetical protein